MFESTIHRLRIFQSVIQSGSFSSAAKKLGITQPSISAHIQALEQELGKQLFTRDPGRKATLTEAGEILYSYTLEITSKTNQVELSLKKLQEKQKQFSIIAQPHIANILLPSYLASFNKTHPNIDILIYSQNLDVVIHHVVEGKSDFGLVTVLQPIDGLYSELLRYENLAFVVGPTHELANRTSIDPMELGNYSYVGGLKTSVYYKMMRGFLNKLGINPYNVVIQLEDYKTIIEVVKRGTGIAILSSFTVQHEINEGHLVRLPLRCEPLQTELRLIFNQDLKMSEEARLFMAFLRDELHLKHMESGHV
ncbi:MULTISPECIES: LysR family transcriptional regulator [unclassified Paenibacillus]|uniref:LysR family transcriptional regulator n=1 Tax=unclassified Paenibacillus TaxID=185978 RepID=UPI001AE703E1|nr:MULTISPECIES: LysR family transcriptional regulator [unclassified Paenibacillus]MBP1154283.1 molybdate transport repressor ModE-like protein [Paenibacillus sp. PvP091]MBP1170332.1 molybdate transport repressor ModE-like protein [Paenibacillus sp. PvR098]MBP2441360.1 molybdate transport repressor ModE-like protein [Paenibacillus sp. PvP052]